MSFYAVSLHVDRADPAMSRSQGAIVRVPPQADWSAAMHEITGRTAAPYASAYLGLHDSKNGSRYFDYAALAHRMKNGRLVPPELAIDALFKPGTLDAVDDVLTRYVRAEIVPVPLNTVRADDHIYLNTTASAFRKTVMDLKAVTRDPPLYNVAKSTCVVVEKGILFGEEKTRLPPIPESVPAGPRRLQTPNHFIIVTRAWVAANTPVDGVILSASPRLLGQYTPG